MKPVRRSLALTSLILSLSGWPAGAEILAMLNSVTKPEQIVRKERIAIIDVDPKSATSGTLIADIPLPRDLAARHIYAHDHRKASTTARGKSILHVMDMPRFPYRMKAITVPECGRRGRGLLRRTQGLVPHPHGFQHGDRR